MQIGISTANLYPLPVEQALQRLLDAGCRTLEVFLNTQSETAPAFIRDLRARADAAGARIVALHPYLSVAEPYILFSAYRRRFEDGLQLFDELYEAAAGLGASFVVLHGDRAGGVLTEAESIERFAQLAQRAQSHGVALAQENVVRFRSSDIAYLRAMREQLGTLAHFVLDIKQCRRCALPYEQVLEAMGDRLCHVHVSDADKERDCLPPGQGCFDFAALLTKLQERSFDGAVILELYRQNFEKETELWDSYVNLCKYTQNITAFF